MPLTGVRERQQGACEEAPAADHLRQAQHLKVGLQMTATSAYAATSTTAVMTRPMRAFCHLRSRRHKLPAAQCTLLEGSQSSRRIALPFSTACHVAKPACSETPRSPHVAAQHAGLALEGKGLLAQAVRLLN